MNLRLLNGKAINMNRVQYFYVAHPYGTGVVTEISVMAVFGNNSWTPVHIEPITEIITVELAQAKAKTWLANLVKGTS